MRATKKRGGKLSKYFTKARIKLSILLSIIYYLAMIVGIYFEESYRIDVNSAVTPSGATVSSAMSVFDVLRHYDSLFYFVKTMAAVGLTISVIVCLWDVFRSECNIGWRRIFIAAEFAFPIFWLYKSDMEKDWSSLLYFGAVDLVPAALIGGCIGILLIGLLVWVRRGFSVDARQ